MRKSIFWISLAILLGITIVSVILVTTAKKSIKTSNNTNSVSEQKSETSSSANPVSKEIIVTGNEYNFVPDSINLQKGETVKLTFKNAGTLSHNLVVDELGVATKTIKGGDSDSVIFTANQAGNFKFYCSIGNHRARGMEGTAIVQ